jgi:Zn-dependent protease/predicted transcriptional regulator
VSVFSRAFRIGSISGIAIRIDPSWFLIAVLFALGFWGQFELRYGHDTPAAIGLAVVAALLFFLSVLAHELAHALEATHRGVEVGGITLFLFGGVTETKFDVKRPFDEFALSAVGPYVSFVLAALFGLTAAATAQVGLGAVADVAGVLGWLNLVLAVFNMLPGAPLDGGRVLRSIAWKVTGDRPRAVRMAARAGQGLGLSVIALGLYQVFRLGQLPFGLFNAFIGWFLYQAARAEHVHTEAQALMEGRSIGSLVSGPPPAVEAGATLDLVVDVVVLGPSAAHPVESDGEVVGVVHYRDVLAVDRERRHTTTLHDVMRPLAAVETVDAETPVSTALDRMEGREVVAVLSDGRVIGLVTRSDLERSLRRLRALGHDRREPEDGHIPGDEEGVAT